MPIKPLSRGELNKLAFAFNNEARIADKNGNHRLSPAEVDQHTVRTAQTRKHMKAVLKAAMKANGDNFSASTGSLYAYAKSLLPELRTAVASKGNKDGKLQSSELKNLSAPARELVEFYDALVHTQVPISPGPKPPTPAPKGSTSTALIGAMNGVMGGLEAFHESGDHGVNVSIRKVPGQTLTQVLSKVHLDPAAPWTNGETKVTLTPASTVAATVAAFASFAKSALEDERTDMPDDIASFTDGLKAQFGKLKDVRLATGGDLGAQYLIGRTSDGYVSIAAQPYRD